MQAKDIPDDAILDIVRMYNDGTAPDKIISWPGRPDLEPQTISGPRWCLTFDLEERMPDVPPKVILAKCRSLIKRRLMHGCDCGCRGDFYLDGYDW